MNKYLIFRTDRIGDFLVSAILIKCIKINDPSANITVIASDKNYYYINLVFISDAYLILNYYKRLLCLLKPYKKERKIIIKS